MRGYTATSNQGTLDGDARYREFGSAEDNNLDPVSALLRAGEIVNRNSGGRASWSSTFKKSFLLWIEQNIVIFEYHWYIWEEEIFPHCLYVGFRRTVLEFGAVLRVVWLMIPQGFAGWCLLTWRWGHGQTYQIIWLKMTIKYYYCCCKVAHFADAVEFLATYLSVHVVRTSDDALKLLV